MKFLPLLLLLTSQHLFALISIIPVEIGAKSGISGKLSASLETKRGNTDKDNYKAGVKIAYDNNNSFVTWAEISGEYGESNNIEDTNKAYLHLRHIHAITKESIRGELFTQTQEDKFRLIQRRLLGGAGLRFKMLNMLKDGNGYVGLGGFYETINYTSLNDEAEKNIRFNIYLAYTLKLSSESKLSYSLYYQPKYDYLKDNIQAHKLDLQLHVYKALYLNLRISYDVDSQPAGGVERYDFYQQTAFNVKF